MREFKTWPEWVKTHVEETPEDKDILDWLEAPFNETMREWAEEDYQEYRRQRRKHRKARRKHKC